jgi:hypothetical protein
MNFVGAFTVGVTNFPRQTMFLIKVPLKMDCCASIFGSKISTTSTTLGHNHVKVGQLLVLIQKIKVGGK